MNFIAEGLLFIKVDSHCFGSIVFNSIRNSKAKSMDTLFVAVNFNISIRLQLLVNDKIISELNNEKKGYKRYQVIRMTSINELNSLKLFRL